MKGEVSNIIIRYALLVLLGLGNLYIIYLILTPVTLYLVYFALKLIADPILISNAILLKGYLIELIPACIAGAAYYLLLILNLTTPMDIEKRIKSLIFLVISFLILNTIRIIVFIILIINQFRYFDVSHKAVWYFGSTVLLVLVWFVNMRLFKIKAIPAYTDLNNLYKLRLIKRKRNN